MTDTTKDDITIDDDQLDDALDPSAAHNTAGEAGPGDGATDEGADDTQGEAADGEATASADDPADDDDVVVTIGDEQPPADDEAPAPEWVRELRKNHRDQARENRELKAKLAALTSTETKPADPMGKKPSLEDFDYDADEFETALTAWHERKRAAEAAETQRRADEEAQQQAWQQRLQGYTESKSSLKVKDFDDAEAVVQDSLSVVQQGIILQGAENPALVMYALGKNPARAKELAAISDPVKFAFEVAKLETKLKIHTKKAPPPPERPLTGNGRVANGGADSTLDRLREEASRTGDMTKVIAHKRRVRESKAA